MQLNKKKLTEVEVGQPVIEEGTYHARLSATTKPSKSRTGVTNLVVTAELLETPNRRQDGEPVERSIKLSNYTPLEATESFDPDERLAVLAKATGFEGEDITLEDIDGKVCKVQVTFEEGDENFGERNAIKTFLPADESFEAPAF